MTPAGHRRAAAGIAGPGRPPGVYAHDMAGALPGSVVLDPIVEK
ncbi:hypothetical protein [Streptomyces sp. NBC_01439]|nr:hypothetical protein [Streptomyces sp. NBC_01439]